MDEFGVVEQLERPTAGVRRVVRMDAISEAFQALDTVLAALGDRGVAPAGPPYARYRGEPTDVVDVEVGFPVESTAPLAAADGSGAPELVLGALPAGLAVETVHAGAYDGLGAMYGRLTAWMAEHHLQRGEDSWEIYESGPASDPDPTTWRTRVVVRVSGPGLASSGAGAEAGARA
ncbi:GyrI-like domain-containing protein [Actinotalea solisilvae]|uniref:GyrI-like domain-containing protein n=1 Tax=Actinotalea solisilvae TaxID=2072922 RepID=UPI0018F16FD3|nr:GyrI-like domain-containing protein [Actinotalea solisilvae]